MSNDKMFRIMNKFNINIDHAGEEYFLLSCGNRMSSWKKWQDELFLMCRDWDGCLFTRADIDNLCDQLDDHAQIFRNSSTVVRPDWKFFDRYPELCPAIKIGGSCAVCLIPVLGKFCV